MKNSPSKVVVARLTAGKLYRFLHGGGARRRDEETSTSGGGKDTYWDAPLASQAILRTSAKTLGSALRLVPVFCGAMFTGRIFAGVLTNGPTL